jgi:hypothetical protein
MNANSTAKLLRIMIYNIGFYVAIILQVALLVHKSFIKTTFLPGLQSEDATESTT